jgi:hypothetical protein
MNSFLRIPLNASPEQAGKLLALQAAFAKACNALAPTVQQTRCWHRVTLHHLAYKSLREQFPNLGSQMVCNVIYSVCRASRQIFQHPQSPFNLARLGERPLPLLNFADTCPVYFDRHTLSLKGGKLSMYTLDGRMRFELALGPEAEAAFREKKLREIVLTRTQQQTFELCFFLGEAQAETEASGTADEGQVPEYVMVEETA